MRRIQKYAVAATLAGGLALAAVTPSQAHWHGGWHHGAGIGAAVGFAAGAAIGAAAANSYYDNGYDDYGYAYAPEPGYAYEAPTYGYYSYGPGINSHRGAGCAQSPGSTNFTGCDGN